MNNDILITVLVGLAVFLLAKYLQKSSSSQETKPAPEEKKKKKKDPRLYGVSKFISPDAWVKFPLKEVEKLSHNVRRYRFGLPDPNHPLGLPLGMHIIIRATINGEEVQRKYTPTTLNDTLGYFDLVVKVYEKGLISKYLDSLAVGDEIEVQGPSGRFYYEENRCEHMGMLAGGTGITPMYQLIQSILKDSNDPTKLSLIFANISEDDILLRSELETLQKEHPDRFHLFYCLNNPPEGWTGGVGFVTKEMIEKNLPPPAPTTKICICGPPPMNKAMFGHLESIGFNLSQHVFKF